MLNQDGCTPINLDFVNALVSVVGMDDATTPEDPIIALILAYCPAAIRPAWAWLFAFQKRINDGVARVGEPVLGQMRIAWWRERISDAETLSAQRDPLLLELADLVERHPSLCEIAGCLLDTIEARITAETPLQWADAIAEEGNVLAGAYAKWARLEINCFGTGRVFGYARVLAGGLPPEDERWQSVNALAEEELAFARSADLPRSLSLMRLYASQILANPNGPARRRDGIKLVIHGLTGWPNY